MASPTAELRLTARDETQAAFNSALAGLRGLESQVKGIGATFQNALGAAGLGFGLKAIFDQAVEAERAQSRLAAVLKSTGYAAGLTAGQINDLADSLSKSTTFDDDALRQGITSLLRFRDVQGDVFEQAAKLATDLAVAMNTDLASAFQTIGKLGTNPTESLKALTAAGMNLSASQIELAKKLEETGDHAGAQKVAFDELAKSIGGSAQGDNAGLYGATKTTGKAWDDFLKDIGRAPLVVRLAVGAFDDIRKAIEDVNAVLDAPWSEKLKVAWQGAEGMAWERNARQAGASGSWGPSQDEEQAAAGKEARDRQRGYENALAWLEKYRKEQADISKKSAAAAKAAADEAKRQKEKELADWIDISKRQLDAEDEYYADSSEALNIFNKNRADITAKALADAQQNALDWAGVADIQKFRDVSEGWGDSFGKPVRDEIEKTSDTMRELGVTFSSAIEDSIVQWKDLSTVVQSFEKDLIRLGTRKLVTEPLFGAASGAFSGIGEWIKGLNLFGSAMGNVMTPGGPMQLERFAAGGIAKRPMLSLFGEGSTPEAYVPLPDGRSIPVTMRGGAGGGTVNNVHITVNSTGGSSVSGDTNSAASRLARQLEAAVKQVLIGEKRPGGLLA